MQMVLLVCVAGRIISLQGKILTVERSIWAAKSRGEW